VEVSIDDLSVNYFLSEDDIGKLVGYENELPFKSFLFI
jgi:hypothetical protein